MAAKSNQGGIETPPPPADQGSPQVAKSNQGGIETVIQEHVAQEALPAAKSNQGGIETFCPCPSR
jgi:hypothetical protein